MVPLYALLVSAVAAVKAALARLTARVERKYARAALAAELLAKAAPPKAGNGSAPDPFEVAKRQYELGRLVEARDKLEAKFLARQARADAAARLLARLTGWKGRAVPYLLGVIDTALALAAVRHFGLTEDSLQVWVAAWNS